MIETHDKVMQLIADELNRAFEIDPIAVAILVEMQAPCSRDMGDEPYIVVSDSTVLMADRTNNRPFVTIVGLLNGLAKEPDGLRVVKLVDADGHTLGFKTARPLRDDSERS